VRRLSRVVTSNLLEDLVKHFVSDTTGEEGGKLWRAFWQDFFVSEAVCFLCESTPQNMLQWVLVLVLVLVGLFLAVGGRKPVPKAKEEPHYDTTEQPSEPTRDGHA
jgi:hypothetical protein